MPKISVLTPTNRYGGIDIAVASLAKQTFTDFEWVLVDSFRQTRFKQVRGQVNYRFPHKHIQQPEPGEEDVWSLNKAWNEGLRNCDGELIVLFQDYLWIPANGLERFWETYQVYKDSLYTGVGNKAMFPDKVFNMGGLITIFEVPYEERPVGVSEKDDRMDGNEGVHEANPTFWEANWAALPRKVAYELGGFDEEYDKGYGCDNVNFAERASLAGYKTYIDKSNVCIGFNQSAFFPRPMDWEEKHNNKGFHAHRMSLIEQGLIPIKCPHLSNQPK